MVHGDFYGEVGKQRMEQTLLTAEHEHLVKQARLAGRSSSGSSSAPRRGLVARSAALIMTLLK